MPKLKTLVLLLVLGCSAAAAPKETETPLEFTRLDLADGRKLKKVVVKSFDAASGKLLVIASGKAMTISIDLVPKPFQDALRANARPSGESLSAILSPATPVRRPAYIATATPVRTVPVSPATPAPAARPDSTAIKNVALDRAQNYYRYEYPAGSGAVRVTAMNFETDDPEVIVGWENRYRVQGRVLLEYFDSRGYSFSRTTDRFDVTLEQKPGKSLQVIDFTRK